MIIVRFSGTIGEKEVAIALNRFGVVDSDSTGPQTQAWFNEIDRDNDGLIDQVEFVELMSLAHDMIFSVTPAFSISLFSPLLTLSSTCPCFCFDCPCFVSTGSPECPHDRGLRRDRKRGVSGRVLQPHHVATRYRDASLQKGRGRLLQSTGEQKGNALLLTCYHGNS